LKQRKKLIERNIIWPLREQHGRGITQHSPGGRRGGYPGGVFCFVWKGLKKRYQPDGINLTHEFNKDLNFITMSRDEDPNVMLDKLEALSARYNTLGLPVLDQTIVARALVVPALIEYASALTAESVLRKLAILLSLLTMFVRRWTRYTPQILWSRRKPQINSQTRQKKSVFPTYPVSKRTFSDEFSINKDNRVPTPGVPR
jgi:hypothetical protein